MRIYMQTLPDGVSAPRFYHLLVEQDLLGGWILTKEWGRQGASGRVKRTYFNQREQAEEALMTARDDLLKRGFRTVFAKGQEQPQ
ncbi:MAG: WGR domain-containing protein [Gammaproteobacteria bacterium]|nr:WGR domain-containing protein [Gammaproteobacteria bacterium]